MRLYDFQFRVLPSAVKQFQGENYSEILAFKEDFIKLTTETFSTEEQPFQIEGLDLKDVEWIPALCNDNILLLLYKFPKQTMRPLCDYVAFWHDRQKKTIHYYTYEVSFENTWVLGSQNEDNHINFGSHIDGSIMAFIKLVVNAEVKDKATNKNILSEIFGEHYQTDGMSFADMANKVQSEEWSIQDIWHRFGNQILAAGYHVDPADIIPLSILHIKYAQRLSHDGYIKKAKPYYDSAINILQKNKNNISQDEYTIFIVEYLQQRAWALTQQGNHIQALKDIKGAREINPSMDKLIEIEYSVRQNAFNQVCTPIYGVVAIIWLLMLLESKLTHTNIIPAVMWEIGWVIWVILLVVQFAVPWIIKKVRK